MSEQDTPTLVIHKFMVSNKPGSILFRSGRLMKVIRWDTQNGLPCFWAVVDANNEYDYQVVTYHTGDTPIIGDFDRIGTTIHDGGQYILHHVLSEVRQ